MNSSPSKPKPRRESDPSPIVFHDFLSIMGSSSSPPPLCSSVSDDRESTQLSLQLLVCSSEKTESTGSVSAQMKEKSSTIEFIPLKPRTDSPPVFTDFSHLLCSASSSPVKTQETPKGPLPGSCHHCLKRKSTAQMESTSASTASVERKDKRAKPQIEGSKEVRMGLQEEWTIRKKLERSDVNNLARLMLPKEAAEKHILAYWDPQTVRKAKGEDREGVSVGVYDRDTNVEETLKLKVWGKGSLVLNDRWVSKFVRRRNLKEGDEIGLFWDQTESRLVFSLIAKA